MDRDGDGLVSHSCLASLDLVRARDRQRARLEAEHTRPPGDQREGTGGASKISLAPNPKYPEYLDEELEEVLQTRRLCVCGLCTYLPVLCQDLENQKPSKIHSCEIELCLPKTNFPLIMCGVSV